MSATIDELAALPTVETYKDDDRSKVWRVEADDAAYVLKRYQYTPLRQGLGYRLGMHPGQRERRGVALLSAAGVPVIEVAAEGFVDKRYVQATRWAGFSLQSWVDTPAWADAARRAAVIAGVADAAAGLLGAGLVHRDLKAGNVLVGDGDAVSLIDVGAVRRSGSERRRYATLYILFLTLYKAGGDREDDQALRSAIASRDVDHELVDAAAGTAMRHVQHQPRHPLTAEASGDG